MTGLIRATSPQLVERYRMFETARDDPPAARDGSSERGTARRSSITFGFFNSLRQDPSARGADLAAACALILFTLPLVAFVCLAIKLESAGPVFSRPPRLGSDGRRFVVLKFRTTVHDPDKAYTQIWDWSARETRVGQFLRYTRFDGLPQLINVVRGETRLLDDWPD